ncbi:hypothetical protein, partial [Ruegeria arenilitoris]|uniref:hypothetical protein n=1 Tax=Ruegeria arenilitoris TaxID=1173585 RepID=UPI001C2C389C
EGRRFKSCSRNQIHKIKTPNEPPKGGFARSQPLILRKPNNRRHTKEKKRAKCARVAARHQKISAPVEI